MNLTKLSPSYSPSRSSTARPPKHRKSSVSDKPRSLPLGIYDIPMIEDADDLDRTRLGSYTVVFDDTYYYVSVEEIALVVLEVLATATGLSLEFGMLGSMSLSVDSFTDPLQELQVKSVRKDWVGGLVTLNLLVPRVLDALLLPQVTQELHSRILKHYQLNPLVGFTIERVEVDPVVVRIGVDVAAGETVENVMRLFLAEGDEIVDDSSLRLAHICVVSFALGFIPLSDRLRVLAYY